MVASKDEGQGSGNLWLIIQVCGAIILVIGVIAFSWLNPNWQPGSQKPPPESETARTNVDPAAEATEPDPAIWTAMSPERNRALLEAARRQVDAGDPVTGALLALQTLPGDADAESDTENLAAAHRILHEAHFNRSEHLVLDGNFGFVRKAVFSPDGTRVVTASSDRSARLWRVHDGALIAQLDGS